MSHHPVIICGGGLAGAAAAIRLVGQRGYRKTQKTKTQKTSDLKALVLERAIFPRQKLCGEFLGPDALTALDELGLLEQVERLAHHRVHCAVFHTAAGRALEVPLGLISKKHPYGLGIPRDELDTVLLHEARRQGAVVMEQCRILPKITYDGALFHLRIEPGNENSSPVLTTPYCMDATGRHGGLTVSHDPERVSSERRSVYRREIKGDVSTIGFKCHVQLKNVPPSGQLQMFLYQSGLGNGYGGIQPLRENRANICCLMTLKEKQNKRFSELQVDIPKLLAETIGRNRVAAEFLWGVSPESPLYTTAQVNLSLLDAKSRALDLIRIGDAMVTIDPFTGSGMALALKTGILAADCLYQGFASDMPYRDIVRQYQHTYLRQYAFRLRLLEKFRAFTWTHFFYQEGLFSCLKPFIPILAKVFR